MGSIENTPPGTSSFLRGARWVWGLFSSVKLAVALILIITVISLLGVFLTGSNLFSSWWFKTPGALLMLNIIICSINRWKGLKAGLDGGPIRHGNSFYTESETHAEIPVASTDEGSELAQKVLKEKGYRVRVENTEGATYIAADKNRHFRLATYISHLSLVLFVLAYVLGSLGFQDQSFGVVEGQTEAVGHNTGLSLKLVSFNAAYYPDGTPKDYASQVVLYDNSKEVETATIRVNHPLIYKGITFYQSTFRPVLKIQIKQGDTTLFDSSVDLYNPNNLIEKQGVQRYVASIDLPQSTTIGFISSSVNTTDSMVPPGDVAVSVTQSGKQTGLDLMQPGIPVDIGGLNFNYTGDINYSGIQVSRDPGNTLIWVASAMFIVGIMLVLYFPHRRIWVLVQSGDTRKNRLLIRLIGPRGFNNSAELEHLKSQIVNLEKTNF